ncbi:MAG: hypothetical protein IPP33_16865 [Flavobacteriales bacterium]|nr:hypothetical protein [Flavobacteriales bacterium]
MTKAAYWAVFGRTERPEGFNDLLLVERKTTYAQAAPDLSKYRRVELPSEYTARVASPLDTMITDETGTARTVYRLGPQALWTPALHIPYEAITENDHAWIAAEWYVRVPSSSTQLNCVHSFEHEEKSYGYEGFEIKELDVEAGRWDTVRTLYLTPEVRTKKDLLRMYFWLRDTSNVLVDGPVVKVYERIAAH